ncbi:hypothetical protein TRFO_18724 [Tritrichomonas foetus]|uniref:Uncharacterized protein n=1 Tax=Tritrichomonas foetus TaxID=1144522 RepID=A0A1J4KLC1_9EUKA|nr:hypothetical protein [Tritrichomonas foetus]OHT11744.1 hypothetical protein TRFO_18724 [Tritrichomonas foetus]|eukprot:OHT11744.1 hypothetical protein TRFO_18724 [Tritrichomonas foetus]
MPAPLQTFEEFQSSRREKMEQVSSDLLAKKEQTIRDMQEHLQDLMVQLGAANSDLADEERDFLSKKENLLTQLKRIKANADTKYSQARMEHLAQMEALQRQYNEALEQIQISMQQLAQQPPQPEQDPRLQETHIKMKNFEDNLRKYKQTTINQQIDDLTDTDNDTLYINRIQQLESQKRELLGQIKDDEHTNQNRIMELTMMLDEQDSRFQTEVEDLQEKMNKREEIYKQQLDKLYLELDKIRDKRETTMTARQEKIAALQAQIDRVENEFRQKLKDASHVADKLKTALVNANLRKTEQLKIEQKRSAEQRQLMQESFQLQQQNYTMQKELQKAKEDSALLRRELSAKIGPRRTASLFL